MIKMIATDLDGTMLKNDWSVSGINAKAVETAQGQGVRWMTVTGRSYRGAMPLMQQYGINCGYVLMNGAAAILNGYASFPFVNILLSSYVIEKYFSIKFIISEVISSRFPFVQTLSVIIFIAEFISSLR